MKKRARILVLMLSLLFVVSFTTLSSAGVGVVVDLDPVMGHWYKFYWSGGEGVIPYSDMYKFTVTEDTYLYVTDAYLSGDQFKLWNFDSSFGMTSSVDQGYNVINPHENQTFVQQEYDSGKYSTGMFALEAGESYGITFDAFVGPFGGGGSYFKIGEASSAVPEPFTALLFGLGLAGLAGLRRKIRK